MEMERFLKDANLHSFVAWVVIFLSPIVFVLLHFVSPSTYGKLHKPKQNWFGPSIPSKWAWMIFESPSWIWVIFGYTLVTTTTTTNNDNHTATDSDNNNKIDYHYNYFSNEVTFIPNGILLLWFFFHYIHRSLVYPCHMSPVSKFPIGLMFFTVPYTVANGYLQTMALCRFQKFPSGFIYSFSFVIGMLLMLIGFTLGFVSDRALLRLRRTATLSSIMNDHYGARSKNQQSQQIQKKNIQQQYLIPRGGGFDLVSMPHYLGEIVEWFGFFMACNYSLASFSFVLWTACNLIPRALAQHKWYQEKFKEEYPKDRTAIIPLIL